MPRKARIDAPGALQHIIFRGIERRKIFWTDEDRDDFVGRLGTAIEETSTACHAWALLPNLSPSAENRKHLAGNGNTVVADRLCCGFNRQHRRSGHLFQNPYKSILCQ